MECGVYFLQKERVMVFFFLLIKDNMKEGPAELDCTDDSCRVVPFAPLSQEQEGLCTEILDLCLGGLDDGRISRIREIYEGLPSPGQEKAVFFASTAEVDLLQVLQGGE